MKTREVTLHKTYEKGTDGKRSTVLYVAEDGNVARLATEEKIKAFHESVTAGTIIRVTAASPTDELLLDLADEGAVILHGHWHTMGIEKGLPPEEIVAKFAEAAPQNFREFTPRPDLVPLRDALSVRNALVQYHGDATRRLKQIGRNRGIADEKALKQLMPEEFADVAALAASFKITRPDGREVRPDTLVNRLAAAVPECKLFNEIAGITGPNYITAATVVVYGHPDKFPRVSSGWHYYGLHVGTDGKAPKRAEGSAVDWNPRLRTTMFLLGDSIMKNTDNPWNAELQRYREEIAAKHPDLTKGHNLNRAKRRVVKEILKRFFLAAKGEDFIAGHKPQRTSV